MEPGRVQSFDFVILLKSTDSCARLPCRRCAVELIADITD